MDTDEYNAMVETVSCIVINRQYSPHPYRLRGGGGMKEYLICIYHACYLPVPCTRQTGLRLAEDSRQYQKTQLHKFKDDLQKNIEKIHENSSETEADSRFVNEVHALASRLKELAKQVKQLFRLTRHHSLNDKVHVIYHSTFKEKNRVEHGNS